MGQQVKITRKLDLSKRAIMVGLKTIVKTANYSVSELNDPGSLIIANNSAQKICFTLPAVTAVNGMVFSFFNMNTGTMNLIGDTNAIVCNYGLSAKSVNFGLSGGIQGIFAQIWGTNDKYLLFPENRTTNALGGYLEG